MSTPAAEDLEQPVTVEEEVPLGTRLSRLRKAGRFAEAADLVRAELPAEVPAQLHLEAGLCLAAVSDYQAANAHLLLAAIDPGQAPNALAKLSEIAWVRHDHVRGRDYALEGLALDPSSRGNRIQLRRNERAETAANALGDTSGMVAHAAFHADPHGNAGDLGLVDSVRRGFDLEYEPRPRTGLSKSALKKPQSFPRWWDVHVHQLFDEQRLAEVNAGDGLVLGGGGLFLPDTAPNGNSGWQWNVPDEMLRRIRVPLVVWAVGYNTFQGQGFHGDRFSGALRTLVEKASFVGLRNSGSIERVREMLPAELAEKVSWQPCPTTVISRLGGPAWEIPGDLGEFGPVLLNCAYDRSDRRFGDGYGRFLTGLRDWILVTRRRGAEVQYAAHCVDDENFVVDLRREHGLSLPVIPMYDMTVAQIHSTYRRASLVVGMRGHAGMIPFGCGTPIVSLVSHPKLTYFLADIERPQWGVAVDEPDLAARLGEVTGEILDDRAAVVADIDGLQQRLFQVTLENLASLPEPLRVVPRG
ncbi:polysaccharide pyruvyl transferase family protein [Kineosporia babensis]|uniref:Polysaccharide pyruvyl transferase family protein n=1 Tax=Kineosporia babensis TaxID=499548 RepID=A0A9X1NEC2_9ACTN|nr:polysaccharide pyruvyl transferase family protein [Kineosporia babensis]MCD5311508.1 polysaccharide pyruvyl transferase family protein [Kineosporia babensis]